MHAEDSSSYSEMCESPKITSPNIFNANAPLYLLFNLKFEIASKTNLTFNVSFLNFPAFDHLPNGEVGSMLFPMSTQELLLYGNPTLFITGFQNNLETGSGSLDASSKINSFCQQINEKNVMYPVICSFERNIWLEKNGKRQNEIEVRFRLECLGQTIVQDVSEALITDKKDAEVKPSEQVQEYDEYCAEMNGHTLHIRMLRNSKKKAAKGSDKFGSLNKTPKNNEIIRKDSQIMFQMPASQALCTKGTQNAMMYNVGTCRNGDAHGHGGDKIKVMPGKSLVTEQQKNESFVIKLGKKSGEENGKGRLELELTAPKPLGPEDFKKPSRDAFTQTEVHEDKAPSKSKKAVNKKKK